MYEKDAPAGRTIAFRSNVARNNSQAYSKQSPKSAALKVNKKKESDSVEDAFFRLADQIGGEGNDPALQLQHRGKEPQIHGAQELWKELQAKAKRFKEPETATP